jgi:GTPase involved in cell partitioning and DNA repair
MVVMVVVIEVQELMEMINYRSTIRNCSKDKETGEILFEITEDGEKVLSRGGKGGLGNWHFRSSTIKPRYSQPDYQEQRWM